MKTVKIFYKPKYSTYISLMMGIGLLFLNNIYIFILGLIFIVVSLYVIFKIENKLVAEIYEDKIVIHNNEKTIIKLNEIVEWSVIDDGIYIKTDLLKEYTIETYCTIKISDTLKKLAKDKEKILLIRNSMKGNNNRKLKR